MKQTLRELLNDKKYQDTNIKVGSKSGTSFFYCGKGDKAYSIPAIRNARENLLKQIKVHYDSLTYRYKHLDKIYEETYEKARSEKRKVKDFEAYHKKMEIRKERERISLPKKIKNFQYDLDTHLLDRPVQEVVYGISPDEKPCWIIYIKGNEVGAYWTIKEYLKRHKGEKE